MNDLREAIQDYEKTLKRLDNYVISILDIANDIKAEVKILEYRMSQDKGAHCTHCGAAIAGKVDDSTCIECF